MNTPEWLEAIKDRSYDPSTTDVMRLLQLVEKQREALEGLGPFAKAIQDHEFNRKYPGKPIYGFNGTDLTFDALNKVHEALTATAEDLAAWRKRERAKVIDECLVQLNKLCGCSCFMTCNPPDGGCGFCQTSKALEALKGGA